MLVSSTDGVGTKSLIARLDRRATTRSASTVVAMSVDDIAVQGAEPLFFLDYISIGKLVPEIVDDIVAGVAEGCRQAGCALLGGEMSEHPDLMEPGEFDLVGFAVGVVERARVLPAGVRAGDRIVGIAQPGAALQRLLARAPRAARPRRARARRARVARRAPLARRRAAPPERDLRARDAKLAGDVDGARVRAHHRRRHPRQPRARRSPTAATRVVHRGTWDEPRIFAEIQAAGDVPDDEMEHVFNLGLGMLAVVPRGDAFHALDAVARRRGQKRGSSARSSTATAARSSTAP